MNPIVTSKLPAENILEESEAQPIPNIDYNENILPFMSDEELQKNVEKTEEYEKNSPIQEITDSRDYAAAAVDEIMFNVHSEQPVIEEEPEQPASETTAADYETESETEQELDTKLISEPEEEVLSEDDLNFIEDVNIGASNIPEELDVPVYPADTPMREDIPVFEQGDRVTHPKYGEGVVEKMIKYGNKTLCSINFANIGRRLLDPAISELEKV